MFGKKKKTSPVTVDGRLSHIAFIMDGNGRWAQKRSLPREVGHSMGAKAFRNIVEECGNIGINTVTVYAFSTENWKRPQGEIRAIMRLLDEYIKDAEDSNEKNRLKIVFLGDKSVFEDEMRAKMEHLEKLTQGFDRTLNIAMNYGGRAEIVRAVNALIASGKTSVTQEDISSCLYTRESPDPDLIVRTAGECRMSNFLMWQSAYSEFYFTNVLWPDFDKHELYRAVEDFYKRKRKYGGLLPE